MQNKWRQWKYKLRHDYLSVENVVLIVAVFLCLMWTYQAVEAMARNWELTERLATKRQELELMQIEVETAELENAYLESDEYRELAARRLAGKQLSGEQMVYLPENSEEAKNKHKDDGAVVEQQEEEVEYSNVEKWWRYLFPER